MGPDEQTTSDMEADDFFASFINAPDDVIARVAAEADTHTGPDLDAIVAESAAFNYWDRRIAAQAARRAVRAQADAIKQVAAATRWAHPNEAARLAPLPAESLALLPKRRVARITDQERLHTAQYWRWVDGLTSPMLANRLKREAVVYERHQRWLNTKEAARAWRREQREFEQRQLWEARTDMAEYRVFKNRRARQQRTRDRVNQQRAGQKRSLADFEADTWEAQALRAEQEWEEEKKRRGWGPREEQILQDLWRSTQRGQRKYWNKKKRELRWVAISEKRALEIALQVYDDLPPQDKNWP